MREGIKYFFVVLLFWIPYLQATAQESSAKPTHGAAKLTLGCWKQGSNGCLLLPKATVGKPYRVRVPILGGTWPFKCSRENGKLPPGLSVHTWCSSGQSSCYCVISGTPQ